MGKIGFIGLGIMGRPMAKNLLKAGYELVVYNRSAPPVEELAELGAECAESVAGVAESCEIIITMLPNSPDVKLVALGEGGIIHHAKPGSLLIDMSSISPQASQEIGGELIKKGVHMLDAPVSGGEPRAIDGSLSIMAGGSREDFERAVPIFEVLGGSAVLVGGLGAGNTCKLVNQVIVAGNIAALSEGLALAGRLGVDGEKVVDAIKGGLAGSAVMNAKAHMMLSGDTRPGFKIDLHIKDLINALSAGRVKDAFMPVTELVLPILEGLSENGRGGSDHSTMYLTFGGGN